jgi:lipopolysaccharide biosynthesis glycosyltransferase
MRLGRRATVEVACATNTEYLPHCATMLHSLLEQQRSRVNIHLLPARDVSLDALQRLSAWVEESGARITAHQVPEDRLAGVPDNFSILTWYRVLLPDVLTDLDRVLYLDCDLIVVDSVDALWKADLSSSLVAAVTTPPFNMEWQLRHCAAHGIPDVDDVFNAGVMLMNLLEWRRGDWVDRVIDYAVAHADHHRAAEVNEDSPRESFIYMLQNPGRLLNWDQDALSAVMHDRRLKLDPRWNVQLNFGRGHLFTAELTEKVVAKAQRTPAILHFEGPAGSKPWHPDADPEDRALYWSHRSRTPWPAEDSLVSERTR